MRDRASFLHAGRRVGTSNALVGAGSAAFAAGLGTSHHSGGDMSKRIAGAIMLAAVVGSGSAISARAQSKDFSGCLAWCAFSTAVGCSPPGCEWFFIGCMNGCAYSITF